MQISAGFNRKGVFLIILLLGLFVTLSTLSGREAAAAITPAEMPVVNDATCWACHPTLATMPTSPTLIANAAGGSHPIVLCTKCHSTTIANNLRMNTCTSCHYGNTAVEKNLLFTMHVNDPGFQNLTAVRHPISSKHQSPSTNCTSCHSASLTIEHYKPGRTDTKNNPINCNTCHTASALGDEVTTGGILNIKKPVLTSAKWYAPTGRTISKIYISASTSTVNGIEVYAQQANGTWGFVYGRAMGKVVEQWLELPVPAKGIYTKMYATSTNYSLTSYLNVPKVVLTPNTGAATRITNAIANNDTRCETCHPQADHLILHISPLDDSCLGSCHNANLVKEHTSNFTTAGKGYTCDTCHSITAPANVKRAIETLDLRCTSCHTSGHNMNFSEAVPIDIPMYTGYSWSAPQDTAVFEGDASAVQGYTKLVISNRRNDVTASGIWDFYQNQLTQKGWTLKTAAPAQGASTFTAEFTKGTRAVTVRCYNSQFANGTGQIVTAGYRVEIWYR